MLKHTLLFFNQISVEGQEDSERYVCVSYVDVRLYAKLCLQFSYKHILLYSWYGLEKVSFLFNWDILFREKLKLQMDEAFLNRY